MIARKKNIAGFVDERGVFRPIRKPSYVGTPKRRAKVADRKKYSRAKAGDLGKAKQERALEDVFAREIRLQQEEREHKQRVMKQIERETLGDSSETTKGRTLVEFVRGQGGIRPGYKFGGKANRGKRISYDAGELAPLTYKESGKRGLVSEKGKKSLDTMFQAARESGYDVAGMDDLINRMDQEIRGGNATYATRGYIDYRDNPTVKANARKSDLYVTQLGPRSFGVFLKTYLLKKFATKVAAQKHVATIRTKAKANPVNIFGVVAGLSGVQTLMQIEQMMKKKSPRRRRRVTPKANGKTTAIAKNPHGDMPSGARFNEKLFDQDLAAIEDGNFRLIRSANAHGKLAGYGKSEIDRLVQRARLAFQLKEMYKRKDNPADIATLLAPLKNNGAFKRMLSRRKAASALKRELKLEAALNKTREKKKRAIAAATNPIKVKLYKFYPGQRVISGGYRGDHSLHDYGVIIKRTAKTVTFKDDLDGKSYARKVRIWGDSETFSRSPHSPNFYARDNQPNKNPRSAAVKKAVTRSANPKDLSKCPKCGKYPALNARNAAVCVTKGCSNYGRFVKKEKVNTETGREQRYSRKNPVSAKKPPRSRTFESFNGRPVTNGTQRPVSRHAPAKLAQLGDLIEIKLTDGHVITPNPSRYKLTAANGRLWIAGGKFAKPNPTAKANEINPLGEIDHVVYRTHKPHHGDAPNTHYIHKLGEETGHRPLLCVDREGFPVIRGGKYKIEARGIVN